MPCVSCEPLSFLSFTQENGAAAGFTGSEHRETDSGLLPFRRTGCVRATDSWRICVRGALERKKGLRFRGSVSIQEAAAAAAASDLCDTHRESPSNRGSARPRPSDKLMGGMEEARGR